MSHGRTFIGLGYEVCIWKNSAWGYLDSALKEKPSGANLHLYVNWMNIILRFLCTKNQFKSSKLCRQSLCCCPKILCMNRTSWLWKGNGEGKGQSWKRKAGERVQQDTILPAAAPKLSLIESSSKPVLPTLLPEACSLWCPTTLLETRTVPVHTLNVLSASACSKCSTSSFLI